MVIPDYSERLSSIYIIYSFLEIIMQMYTSLNLYVHLIIIYMYINYMPKKFNNLSLKKYSSKSNIHYQFHSSCIVVDWWGEPGNN